MKHNNANNTAIKCKPEIKTIAVLRPICKKKQITCTPYLP